MDAKGFPPLDRLEDLALRRLLAGTQTLSFRAGKALFYQGDRANRTFLVLGGTVRTLMYRSDETNLDLGIQGPGDWLGLPEMVVEGPYLTDALPLEVCQVQVFDRSAFSRLRSYPEGEAWLTGELARRCYSLHARIELVQPGLRLARWLADHASGPIVATQEELALTVGTSRETINRHLGRMQAEGLVKVERGRLQVLDAEGLATWEGGTVD